MLHRLRNSLKFFCSSSHFLMRVVHMLDCHREIGSSKILEITPTSWVITVAPTTLALLSLLGGGRSPFG